MMSAGSPLMCSTTFDGGQVDGPAAQDHDASLAVGPGLEAEHRLEGVSTHHEGVDGGDEVLVAAAFVLTSAPVQEVGPSVRPRDESVHAHTTNTGTFTALRDGV